MMAFTTLEIPLEYGYVILAATSTFILNTIHGFNTGSYRKAAGVPYPIAYASDALVKVKPEAHAFNCAQRAHANFTENQSSLVGALLIAGLKFPLTAAAMGAGWSVSRYLYMLGYSRPSWGENGRGRYKGIMFMAFQLGLVGMAGYTGVMMILGA